MNWADDAPIRTIFADCRSIAVVGLSSNPTRPSHRVAARMQASRYRIIPVNPNETTVLGEQAYPSLRAVPDRVDLVDIFRKAEDVPAIVEEAIAKGAQALWMQEGVVHEAAANRARQAGLLVVMDRCWKKELDARTAARSEG
jgi:predicted CoA-binding protein